VPKFLASFFNVNSRDGGLDELFVREADLQLKRKSKKISDRSFLRAARHGLPALSTPGSSRSSASPPIVTGLETTACAVGLLVAHQVASCMVSISGQRQDGPPASGCSCDRELVEHVPEGFGSAHYK
jgi:hypothetical protein